MGLKYALKTVDGDDAGTHESPRCDWQPGDVFVGHGNTHWRIVAVVPLERIAEFHDKPLYGLWQVEPA